MPYLLVLCTALYVTDLVCVNVWAQLHAPAAAAALVVGLSSGVCIYVTATMCQEPILSCAKQHQLQLHLCLIFVARCWHGR